MKKATLIAVDGTRTEVAPADGKKLSLAEMQKCVGGWIERVPIKGGEMYVDEEGLLKGLPANGEASEIAGQHIVGNALVFTRK